MSNETFLLTGSMGCIGAWVLRLLIDEGVKVVATDLETNPVRPRLLMNDDEIASVTWEKLDVTDASAVSAMVAEHGVTHMVHLAGLQIPFCRANPSLGAAVNVQGTINVFEAACHNNVQGLSYASSLAALGPAELYPERPIKDDVHPMPNTLYGAYKVCNEQTAQVYWNELQLGSVGLRPHTVYGVCRDQGVTSDIAKSILATAAGRPFNVRFSGEIALQYARDVAKIFIECARLKHQGAAVCNLRHDIIKVEGFVEKMRELYPQAQLSHDINPLPFPADLDDSGLRSLLGEVPHTELSKAIQQDIASYTALIKRGALDLDATLV